MGGPRKRGNLKNVYEGPATYSDLARDSRGNIYCVFGRDGNNHNIDLDPTAPRARVSVARFNLEWLTGEVTPTLVIDDASEGFETSGVWEASSSEPGLYAGRSLRSDDGNATATWTPDVTVAGSYEVYMRWPVDAQQAAAVQVEIASEGGSVLERLDVDQSLEGGTWHYLGTFDLAEGQDNFVRLSAPTGGLMAADAVMLQKL